MKPVTEVIYRMGSSGKHWRREEFLKFYEFVGPEWRLNEIWESFMPIPPMPEEQRLVFEQKTRLIYGTQLDIDFIGDLFH